MIIEESLRRKLGIASTMDELETFSAAAKLGYQVGFPVLIIPFGAAEAEGRLIQDETELMIFGADLLKGGAYGYVHVIKVVTTKHESERRSGI